MLYKNKLERGREENYPIITKGKKGGEFSVPLMQYITDISHREL